MCSETPHRPRCLAPSPAPNPQTPVPKARTPSLGSKCEPWCPALIPVPPGTSPISAPLHAAEPSRSPSAAAPNPLPKLAPCPAHPKARGPAHASVPVSPRPRQHSSPAPLSARISTGATSSVSPPLLQPHVPPHPSAPGWGQRTGTGLSTGDRGCPAMGAQLGVPTSRERACPLRAQHVPRRGTAPSPAGAAPQAAGLRPKLLPQQTPCEATNPAAAAAATAAPPNLGQGCESRTPGVTQRRRGSAGEGPGRAAGSPGATPGTARGQGWGCPRGMEGTRARCSPARLQAGFGPTGHVERILQVFLVGSSGCWPQKPDCRPRVTAAGEGQESEGTTKPLL